ncbi:MAG: ATP-grasp domain-containing protein [Gammaproteobacteria bacterium]|nr:ATP-grasp domain-containing protein [Gammaproteobacteria bacterium]
MPLKDTNKTVVLVLDANQRSALAVSRSIGALENTRVITADSMEDALAANSRFSHLYLQCPSAKNSPDAFINWLSEVILKYSINLLLPVTEITSQLILIYKDKIPNVELPFASYQQVMNIANKVKITKVAPELNIPVPGSKFYACAEELDVNNQIYPCVLKPALSHIFENNRWVSTQVRILQSVLDLKKALDNDKYLVTHEFMIQEFIPGHGAGIFCFYDKGEPKAFFAHRRIREKPPWGGVSVLSESIEIDERLKDYAQSLLNKVKWHGVAMVEFRIDPAGQPYLMEVNTRFWGSLQLSIDSGVNFPRWVYSSQMKTAPPIEEEYRKGVRLRWLLGDVDGLYIYLKSGRYTVVEKITRCIQFVMIRPFKTKHEINRFLDIKPALFEFKAYIRQFVNE